MGAFALANLCLDEENRDTLKQEETSNGFDLLQLTVGYKDDDENRIQMEDTHKLAMQALSFVSCFQ